MKQNFDACLTRLLKDEGGYGNDPQDPGGPTNFGITLTDYRKYINKNGTAVDVKNMKVADAATIYKARYWDALDCDSLPSGVDYTCFDYGVNSGLGRPRSALKKFAVKKGVDLINAINDERMSFLRGLSTFPRFGKGWTRRVNGVRAYSLELAKQNNVPGPAAGAATVVTVGTATYFTRLSQFWHNHEVLVISVAVGLALAIAYGVHLYVNRGKK